MTVIDERPANRIARLCAEQGLRMTGQRRTIAQVLSNAADHPNVEEVHARAHRIDTRISLSTVYRTVRLLEQKGILARHEFGEGRGVTRKRAANTTITSSTSMAGASSSFAARKSRSCKSALPANSVSSLLDTGSSCTAFRCAGQKSKLSPERPRCHLTARRRTPAANWVW